MGLETTLSLLSWWQWSALLLVPPAIVALYFLKLKRQPLEVPSTYLWRKSIEDLHVNSLWQRMRQNLLLFMQLLLILLLLLALLRPSFRGAETPGERSIFLIDNSASMSATDAKPTRLELAKQKVAAMIDSLDGGSVMLISFSDNAHIEQGFTSSKRDLRRALEAIAPTNRSTDLIEALRVAAGRSYTVQLPSENAAPSTTGEPKGQLNSDQTIDAIPAKLYIVSDGKFADVQNFSLGSLEPTFLRIGLADTGNVGITTFATRRNEEKPEKLQAFARLENSGDQPVERRVDLDVDGQPRDSKTVTVPARGGQGIQFDVDDVETAALHLKLSPGDSFTVDDEAWTVINPHRLARVLLVSPGNSLLERALNTARAHELAEVSVISPDLMESEEQRKLAASGKIDLVIYDGRSPKTMPQANTLFIGCTPPIEGWSAGEKQAGPQIIDIDHAHPIMQLVEMSDVYIAEGFAVNGPPGSQRLIDSNRGTLLAIGPREGFEDAVLGFGFYTKDDKGEATDNTTWPLRLSFPVFFHNILEYLGGNRTVATGIRAGSAVNLTAPANLQILQVRTPHGNLKDVSRGKLSTFQFSETDELGIYAVEGPDHKVTQRFAVNLFDPAESDIRSRLEDSIKIGYEKIVGRAAPQPVRRDLWKWLVALALGLLLAEWYIYNRRVYI